MTSAKFHRSNEELCCDRGEEIYWPDGPDATPDQQCLPNSFLYSFSGNPGRRVGQIRLQMTVDYSWPMETVDSAEHIPFSQFFVKGLFFRMVKEQGNHCQRVQAEVVKRFSYFNRRCSHRAFSNIPNGRNVYAFSASYFFIFPLFLLPFPSNSPPQNSAVSGYILYVYPPSVFH